MMNIAVYTFALFAVFSVCYGSQYEEAYKIFHSGRAVLGGNITFRTEEIPNMQRPYMWSNGVRNFECHFAHYKIDKYEIRQSGNVSTLSIKNVSQEDLSWSFRDANDCYARVFLILEGWQCEKVYKIVQKERVVLGGKTTLQVEDMPYIVRPVVWRNRIRNVECNRSYCVRGKYVVRQVDRFSTLFIGNISKEDLSWNFHDNNSCNATITLVAEDWECEKVYKIVQKGKVFLGGNITLQTEEMPNMAKPVLWTNGVHNLTCNKSHCKHGNYELKQGDRFSTLSIRNVTKEDLNWNFHDKNPCYANVTLVIEDVERSGIFSTLKIVGIVIGTFVLVGIILGIPIKIFYQYKSYMKYQRQFHDSSLFLKEEKFCVLI